MRMCEGFIEPSSGRVIVEGYARGLGAALLLSSPRLHPCPAPGALPSQLLHEHTCWRALPRDDAVPWTSPAFSFDVAQDVGSTHSHALYGALAGASRRPTLRMTAMPNPACSFDLAQDMGSVYSLMGACPQHDLLWSGLTGREHLLFYGRLK